MLKFCFVLLQFAQSAFPKTKALNRIQTVVFKAAFQTNENLLICAPTGAGKTNIAMLCILREIKRNMENGVVMKDRFKVINLFLLLLKASACFEDRLRCSNESFGSRNGDEFWRATALFRSSSARTYR